MKLINNISLRAKLLLIVFPLLAGLVYFASISALDSYRTSHRMDNLEQTVAVSIQLGALAHEIQKERGNSSGYLSSNGEKFQTSLADQRALTNQILDQLPSLFDTYKASVLAPYQEEIAALKRLTNGVSFLRSEVDNLALSPNEAIREYTKINTLALAIIEGFGNDIEDVSVFSQLLAYSSFLKSKERAGIERALGTQGFVLGKLSTESFQWYNELVAAQNTLLDIFENNATPEAWAYFEEQFSIAAVTEVERMRELLITNENLAESPEYWFGQITLKINALKKVEDYLASDVAESSGVLAAQANASFQLTVAGTVAASLIVLFVLFTVLSNLLGNIKKLSAFSNTVGKGNLKARVAIDSKDELGTFANTMNRMVGSVRKAAGQLKIERDKASYLYRNVYRTSEIIFSNVNQGFFLIDKNLKMSKTYSKSTENIFEQTEVGGRDFLEFINPRLLPRDREALKVFSKHLFNPKIKDRVLANLNPVESVNIYGDENQTAEGEVKTKYLKIDFRRIKSDNGTIREVMVTATDETKEVLLRKEIQDNQKKNKQETEQLLNIIKMDPVSLQDFLERSKQSLEDINRTYETFKGTDFRELVIYTFNVIHNLKGNAGLIDFELMESKFNDVEDILIKLRNRDIDGEDFIKVLYEIKEIQFSMMDMSRMMRRIAGIYQSSKENEVSTSSNITLEHSFNKIVEKLNDTTDKEARLRVVNEAETIIPDHLKIAVNDIVIQLIRNSYAHGIEAGNKRIEAGKAAISNLKLSLDSNSDALSMTYQDDGSGIDVAQVYSKAKALGVYKEDLQEQLGDRYAHDLIFGDGLSTNEKKGLSGRGQGMSLIKGLMTRYNASYDIKSEKGAGFSIRIEFPLTSQVQLTELIA